jgi:CRP/FNR family transcriptional regulator, cyclic AMP receptor protein
VIGCNASMSRVAEIAEIAEVSLKSIGLFRGLDEHRRRELISCARPRYFRRGELLYVAGAASCELLLLMSGVAVVFRSTVDGRRATLAAVRSPGLLGEEALADEVPRTASAEALEESFALALPRTALLAVMQEHPAVCDAARRCLAERLTRVTEQRADHMLLDLPTRVAKTLLRLAERSGKPPLVIDFSQGLVAALAGGSRQSVNQTLQRFAGRGWLRIEKTRIVVADPDALKRRAGQPAEVPVDLAVAQGTKAI